MDFQEVFKQLNGRTATPADINRFERLTLALETSPGDALLAVLVALDHYETLYADIPEKISHAATVTLEQFKTSSDATALAAIASAKADLTKAVSEAAQKTLQNDSKKNIWQWVGGCVVASLICFAGSGWWLHEEGYASGYKSGYHVASEKVKDEKEAAAWGNSEEGKAAHRLAQVARISSFLNCSEPGWSVENGGCFVKTASDGKLHGWKLP